MGFFGKLFGLEGDGDERKALAAEAAGDYVEAARLWALAGHPGKVAEMHVLRAERASEPAAAVAALRDALRWARPGGPVEVTAKKRLAEALVARARAEGLGTEADKAAMREAAQLFEGAGDFAAAGQAWEAVGDDDEAARAYEKGGHLDKMELALAREEKRARGGRRLKEAFEEYEVHFQGGDRESARAALVRCVDLAEDKGEYRRLLGELDGRRLADGRLTLARAGARVTTLIARPVVAVGRDAGADLALRAGGISRVHAEILADEAGFRVRDAGSRNGTLLGGLPVAGELPLEERGQLGLGEDCALGFELLAGGAVLRLEVARGLDKGVVALVLRPGARAALQGAAGMPAQVHFRDGRPYLETEGGRPLRLNGVRIARGAVQLVRRDVVTVDDVELEVV